MPFIIKFVRERERCVESDVDVLTAHESVGKIPAIRRTLQLSELLIELAVVPGTGTRSVELLD